jgi:hypothetical protein
VVREGLKVTRLIQVCREPSDPKTRRREVRALLKAGAELKCQDLAILTADTEAEEALSWFGHRGTIKFMPMFKWLAGQI